MKAIDLNGNRVEWKIKGENVTADLRPRSKLHLRAREILRGLFPTSSLKEEVPIPVTPKQTLFIDLFLPLQKLAIEVHGGQHYKFSSHFHQSAAGFIKHKKNDRDKAEWCSLNGIKLVILPYNEDDDEWTERIQLARKG